MDEKQIIRCIDNGANYYLRLFGEAEHMDYIDNGYYSYVKPKDGEKGITFVFHLRLENLPREVQQEKMSEIKALGMPIWLDLLASKDLFRLTFGTDKESAKTVLEEGDEAYMALLPQDIIEYIPMGTDLTVVKVESAEQFKIWARIANDLLGGGNPDMHPEYHYPLVQKGLMRCYIAYKDGIPASVSSIMEEEGNSSLELVATIPEFRRLGLAKAVCAKAIEEALHNGSQIITLRAIGSGAIKLYESLGFKCYNYAL